MVRTRKPKVDWPAVYKIIDDAKVDVIPEEHHGRLRATLKLIENHLTPQERSSEKSSDLAESSDASQKPDKKPKKGGKGRNSAADQIGAERNPIPHPTMEHGGCCPDCEKGKVYECKVPALVPRFEAQPLIAAAIHELQRLKCNFCSAVFTAPLPENLGTEKYDESVAAVLATSRYGAGLPAYRLESFLKQFGILIPDSTQWALVWEGATLLRPLHGALLRYGANCRNLYGDDTGAKVLHLNRTLPGRTGTFTTALVGEGLEGKVALYFTGEKHAGENLADLLKQRVAKEPPIVMFDALSRNVPKGVDILLCNCLTHGRRNFAKIIGTFPEECTHLLTQLGLVYFHDAETKTQGLSPEGRLAYHQMMSQPILEELHVWATATIGSATEPNSLLGKALGYLLKHWKGLTEFLRTPGAPLDNNICERAIKKVVLYRKNSLFYRTENGAAAADIYLSIIHTCELNHIPAFPYLVALLKNADQVLKNPDDWLPWTYRASLAALPP